MAGIQSGTDVLERNTKSLKSKRKMLKTCRALIFFFMALFSKVYRIKGKNRMCVRKLHNALRGTAWLTGCNKTQGDSGLSAVRSCNMYVPSSWHGAMRIAELESAKPNKRWTHPRTPSVTRTHGPGHC